MKNSSFEFLDKNKETMVNHKQNSLGIYVSKRNEYQKYLMPIQIRTQPIVFYSEIDNNPNFYYSQTNHPNYQNKVLY